MISLSLWNQKKRQREWKQRKQKCWWVLKIRVATKAGKHKRLFWIWNATNQMIVFSAFIQSGYRGNKQVRRSFFQCSLCHIINLLLSKLARSRWLGIGLVLFFAFLWTSTSSRSIKTQKQNSANIQPSWPGAWSIIYTYLPGAAPLICYFRYFLL